MNENEKRQLIFNQSQLWEHNSNTSWLASSISLKRNLEKFKFPNKLNAETRKQILSLLSKEILDSDQLQQPTLIRAEQVNPFEKEFLVEHFLSHSNFHEAHAGEAFIVDQSGKFLALINIENHLQLQLLDTKGELENVWNKLVKMEIDIGKKFSYAFSSKFGFLTSDFQFCGTGLVVSNFLHLPALIHLETIDELLEKYADDSILITGIQGDPTEIIGDVVDIQNNYTLGLNEENILSGLRSFITKLLIEENSAKNHIRHTQKAMIKDRVSRAFGILIHSYQIEAIEALNAVSLLKLGLELDWIAGISLEQINSLFFNCRRSHLLHQFSEKVEKEELPHKRAEYIHKQLKDAHLKI